MKGKILLLAAVLVAIGIVIYTRSQPEVAPPSPVGERSGIVERVGAGVISTDRNETFPAIDPVTGTLYYSVYDDSFDEQTIMFARQDGAGWGEPQIAPFSGRWKDRAPRFSADGTILYITSNRPGMRPNDGIEMDLWMIRRNGSKWGPPVPQGYPTNSWSNDMHAGVTDGDLWFASDRESSLGGADIYHVSYDGTETHLPAPVNSELSQPDLWISNDESWMILVITDHPDGHGGDDLYLSRLYGDAWSVPTNLGPEVNSAEYEYGPAVSPDGEYLYFTSHRGGNADIYRVPLRLVVE